jgi:hypothetical protein
MLPPEGGEPRGDCVLELGGFGQVQNAPDYCGRREREGFDGKAAAKLLREPTGMNGVQRRPELAPLLLAHSGVHGVPARNEWVEHQAPSTAGAPERGRSRLQRSEHVADAALKQCPRNEQPRLLNRPESDLEEIGNPIRGDDLVDGGGEVVAKGKKRDRAHAQPKLRFETGGYRVEIEPRVIPCDIRPYRHLLRLTGVRTSQLRRSRSCSPLPAHWAGYPPVGGWG